MKLLRSLYNLFRRRTPLDGIGYVTSSLNGGLICIYEGAARPQSVTIPIGQKAKLLATLRFHNPAFKTPVNGVSKANPIISGEAISSGKASFARLYKADGRTGVLDMTVGRRGCNLNLTSTMIQKGGIVSITEFFVEP